MEKVAECVGKLPEILDAYRRQDTAAVEDLAYILSRIEHEADLIKNDIRNSMPRGLFMPVDRTNLLRILNIQDSIANRAENIGVLLTFKQAGAFDEFETAFDAFVAKCLEAFNLTRDIIDQLDELLETGFGGTEAQTVKELVDQVAFKEYESDIGQRELLRLLLAHEDSITYGDFFLWTRIIQQVGGLADRSNNLAAAVRMTLDTK
jgi:predicted phosphate transport protein (TIGR00153 family)